MSSFIPSQFLFSLLLCLEVIKGFWIFWKF
nr:MAG TPA: hypothetical protein [Caudoviricetes sp.]